MRSDRRWRTAGALLLVGAVVVGACRRRPDPAQAPEVGDTVTAEPATGPVTIQGRVVEAGTGEGIGDAVVIVLEAGVTSEEWLATPGRDASAELMEGTTLTDSAGGYEIPALQRGSSYTVMVTAQGYAPAIFEEGLAIEEDDEPVTVVGAVELAPR